MLNAELTQLLYRFGCLGSDLTVYPDSADSLAAERHIHGGFRHIGDIHAVILHQPHAAAEQLALGHGDGGAAARDLGEIGAIGNIRLARRRNYRFGDGVS